MNRSFAILLALFLMLGTALPPAAAEDAVSSATVNITALPELKENQSAASLVIFFSTDDTVKAVKDSYAEYYTCHCTGKEQFLYLKDEIGEKMHEISCGETIEIQ